MHDYLVKALNGSQTEKYIHGILNGIDTDVFNPETTKGIIHFNKESSDKKREK